MDFTYNNTALWNLLVQLGMVAAILLLANVLRRKIPFIKKALMPTAVLAGFLALFLRLSNILRIDTVLMEMITYHTIAIGFIALSLIIPKRQGNYSKAFVGSKTGALIVSTYLIQGIIGLGVSIGLSYTIRPGLFKAAGLLLPMGFGQGPGQANNVGSTYEAMGFAGGQSFGLSIAAMGFLVACIVGVIYLNILKKKGIGRKSSDPIGQELASIAEFEDKNEIPVAESVDRFSVQLALVLLVYLATWLASTGITKLLLASKSGFIISLIPLIWGFNFILGSLFAVSVRGIMRVFRNYKWMTHQYQNNYLLARIAGYSFDLMIVTGICTINIEKLAGLWLPFILMCVIGTVVTLFYLQWFCKRIYPDYYYEGFLSLFGMLTGVISSGILLLREVDPKYETPAANNLVLGSSFAIGFGFPVLILIGMAPRSDLMALVTVGILTAYMVLLWVYMIAVKPKKT